MLTNFEKTVNFPIGGRMKRLISISLLLFASLASAAELSQQQAVIVPAPSANGYWSATDKDGKQFVPQTLADGSALVTVPCVLSWSASPITSTQVVVGSVPVVPPAPGPTATISATPEKIVQNGKTLVSWKAGGTATTATMQAGSDPPTPVQPAGAMEYAPRVTTDYTLRATSADGRVSAAKATVVVDGTGPQPPPVDPAKPLGVTYVYEKDDTAVPNAVSAALIDLNRKAAVDGAQKVVATEFEVDTVDGAGKVPTQYVAAQKAAVEAGIPCLVVEQDGKVLKIVDDPQTTAHVMDAVKPFLVAQKGASK